MSQILNRVRDVDPNDSDAVKEALTAFFQTLPKHKELDNNRWLRALENILNRFPKFCGQHRATIETYLCHFLDSNNYHNVIEAAKCAHSVQQVRLPQEKSATPKSCWRDQMSTLCDAAHTLVDALFTNSASIYRAGTQNKDFLSSSSQLHTALAEIDSMTKSQEVVSKSAVLSTRLRNVLVFIQAMLVEIFPVAKPIRPQLIMEVILRALSASRNEDSAKVTAVKVQALKTLDALVMCLGPNLIPFSALVFRFVMQTLRWSSENQSEESRKVRCTAYNSLTKWLNTLHAHKPSSERRTKSWDDELTSHIASDVTPTKHVIQLTANAQPMKNLSKKARKKLANSMLKQSNIAAHMPGGKNKISIASEQSNDEVAVAALECAETFLIVCGVFLKPTIHKQLQELLVRECYNIHSYSTERALWLLRSLEASRKSASSKVPPPTHYCLQLYSVLLNSAQSEISKLASHALLDIRLHLHCSPSTLNFALEPQPETKKSDDNRKRVSERNRAVLESLLGQERMPSEDLAEEEVITIPDEPRIKKPRINEDVADKISLSSESDNSVEINDDSTEESIEQTQKDVEIVIEEDDGQVSIEVAMERDAIETEQPEINTTVSDNIAEQNDETDASSNIKENDDIDVERNSTVSEENNEQSDETYASSIIKENDDIDVERNSTVSDDTTEQNGDTDASRDIKDNEDIESTTIQDISEAKTQNPIETDENHSLKADIFEAKTQLPLRASNDTVDGDKSPSMEVSYDYPNTGTEKVTVLEKMDDENLPSTNETDDVQITCGQVVKSSQDVDADKGKYSEVIEEVPKENGVDKPLETIIENGDVTENDKIEDIASKKAPNGGEITVEDMLADFVDEVDESQIQT